MDKGLLIKEFAPQLSVTENTVINWDQRGVKPQGRNIERVREFIEI